MITIAWDVDDVLNDLMVHWFNETWLPAHRGCTVSFEQITENPPERILSCSKEEYISSLDTFRLSGSYSELAPNPEILHWFEQSGHRSRHIALTAVPIKAADISARWTIRNFGNWIRSFNFVPSARSGNRVPEYESAKSEFLKCFTGVKVLVDDNEKNVRDAEKLGIRGIVVKRPWNTCGLPIHEVLAQINQLI